jgi:hypothetical protein
MRSNSSLTIQQIYPDHVYISLDNCPYPATVKKHLKEKLGLDINTTYPSNIKLFQIDQLIDGFVLNIENARIVFIPSDEQDMSSFEVAQEWIDLPNLAADYYVPIQIDINNSYLHLWGFVTHRQVKEFGEFDRIFRTYTIDSQDLNDDLDALWLKCELQAQGEMVAEQLVTLPTPLLSPDTAQEIIHLLLQHKSIFSPRLEFSFEQWGGILNQPEWLEKYLDSAQHPLPVANQTFTKLSDWLDRKTTAIYQDWQSIGEFFATSQIPSGLRSFSKFSKVKELTICPQNTLVPHSMTKNIEELIAIMQSTASQQERWDAIEYLWQLDPDHPSLPIYKLLDLGLFFQGEQLSLLVSVLSTSENRLGLLIRLSPNQADAKLPSGIQLSRLDESGNTSRQVTAQAGAYQCLQLIFDADLGDLFSICVTLRDNKLIKHFQV